MKSETTYNADGSVRETTYYNEHGTVQEAPLAFVDGVPVYDEDTLNALTAAGSLDTSFEGLVAGLELNPAQQANLIRALEAVALDDVDSASFYQMPDGSILVLDENGDVAGSLTVNAQDDVMLTTEAGTAFYVNTPYNHTAFRLHSLINMLFVIDNEALILRRVG